MASMCLDCGDGACIVNTTLCLCSGSLQQSLEMFTFPADFVCSSSTLEDCLPCDTNREVVDSLYIASLVFTSLVVLTYPFVLKTCRKFKKYFMRVFSFVCMAIASALRVAKPTRYFGSDLWFTLMLALSLAFIISSHILELERYLAYLISSVQIYENKKFIVRVYNAMKYTNIGVSGAVVAIFAAIVPMVFAMTGEELAKSPTLRPTILACGVVLAYMLIANSIIFQIVMKDLRTLRDRQVSKDEVISRQLKIAMKKLNSRRIALWVAFVPTSIIYCLFYIPDIYRFGRYMIPALNVLYSLAVFYALAAELPLTKKAKNLEMQLRGPTTRDGSAEGGSVTIHQL